MFINFAFFSIFVLVHRSFFLLLCAVSVCETKKLYAHECFFVGLGIVWKHATHMEYSNSYQSELSKHSRMKYVQYQHALIALCRLTSKLPSRTAITTFAYYLLLLRNLASHFEFRRKNIVTQSVAFSTTATMGRIYLHCIID